MFNKINIIGCGYIGKQIAESLQDQSVDICCFVKSEKSEKNCQSMGFNVLRIELDKIGLGLNRGDTSVFEKSAIIYLVPPQREGNIDSRMKHFVLALEKLEVAPSKILLISTTGVYGDCQGGWIDEQQPVKPQADRAIRRLSGENQLKAYCEKTGTQYLVFRVPGIYAADKLPIKRITSGEPIVNSVDSGYTNRIHAKDLVAFCVEAVVENVEPAIYNCCDGHPSTMNDYFFKVADAMALARPKEISLIEAQQVLSSGMLSYLAESKRISNKKLLNNFKTQFKYPDLEAGLASLKIKNNNH